MWGFHQARGSRRNVTAVGVEMPEAPSHSARAEAPNIKGIGRFPDNPYIAAFSFAAEIKIHDSRRKLMHPFLNCKCESLEPTFRSCSVQSYDFAPLPTELAPMNKIR